MKKSVSFWHTIGASQTVINTILFGYKIPFIDTPKRVHFCNSKSAMENVEFVSNSMISPLSVATSSAGKKRLILDLRYVNSHIYKEYIHFEDWRSFEKFLILDCFVYKFDLKSGYHHIDIFPSHQTFLGIYWGTKYYVFTILPF